MLVFTEQTTVLELMIELAHYEATVRYAGYTNNAWHVRIAVPDDYFWRDIAASSSRSPFTAWNDVLAELHATTKRKAVVL